MNHVGNLSVPDYMSLKAIPRSYSNVLGDELATSSHPLLAADEVGLPNGASELGEDMYLNSITNTAVLFGIIKGLPRLVIHPFLTRYPFIPSNKIMLV